MLEIIGGRVLPRLNKDTRRLTDTVEKTLKSSEPFLGTVADKVEEIIEGRKGNPYAILTYDGSAPVSVDQACRFVQVDLDVEVEGDTVLLLADIIEEQFLREYPADRSLAICFCNPTENKLIISLAGIEDCAGSQAEIEVEPAALKEINVYSSPTGILYVVAGDTMNVIPCFSLL